MLVQIVKPIKIASMLLCILTILTGLLYPALITTIAQLFFPWQANGSLLKQQNVTIGSALIGQNFTDAKYFAGRPSATAPNAYNAHHSSGSNLGPSNPELIRLYKQRIEELYKFNEISVNVWPIDLVAASGSGLDPEISIDSAMLQVPRIAKQRKLNANKIEHLIKLLNKTDAIEVLNIPRVNVLELNLALDQLATTLATTKE